MPDGLSAVHILILAGAFLFFYVSSKDIASRIVAMATVLVAALAWQALPLSDDDDLRQAQALFDACPTDHRARIAIAVAPHDASSAEVLNELIVETGTHVAIVLDAGTGAADRMSEAAETYHVASIAGWDEETLLLINETMTDARRFEGPAELRLEDGRRIQVRFDERSPDAGLSFSQNGVTRWNGDEISLEASHGFADETVADDMTSIRPDWADGEDAIRFGLAEFCFLWPQSSPGLNG